MRLACAWMILALVGCGSSEGTPCATGSDCDFGYFCLIQVDAEDGECTENPPGCWNACDGCYEALANCQAAFNCEFTTGEDSVATLECLE